VVDAVTNTTTNNLRVRVRGLVATTSTVCCRTKVDRRSPHPRPVRERRKPSVPAIVASLATLLHGGPQHRPRIRRGAQEKERT
jgi:hypothetical protein